MWQVNPLLDTNLLKDYLILGRMSLTAGEGIGGLRVLKEIL